MKGRVFMKTAEKAVAIGLCIAIVLSFTGFCNTRDNLTEEVLRLHIVANSDSDADQQLKLKIRDEILKKSELLISEGDSLEEAVRDVSAAFEKIEKIAEATALSEGFDYDCTAEIKKMYFDIREYDDVSMPSGYYTALRITIGEGKGKNWWCVMFPPLCLPAAEGTVADFDEDEQAVLKTKNPEYEIKFKVVEIWEDICNKLKEV